MTSILIVEDSPVERIYVESLLQRQWPDATISTCEDAVSALPLIERNSPDLIITDLQLPGGDRRSARIRVGSGEYERPGSRFGEGDAIL